MLIHPSQRSEATRVLGLAALLAVTMAIVVLLPTPSTPLALEHYLPLHIGLEILPMVIASLIFAVGWHARRHQLPGNLLVLSCLFLGVALLDLSHMLSYQGMPDYFTPAGTEKAINFWLGGRLLAAIALLAVALRPWRSGDAPNRTLLLGATLAMVVLVHVVIIAAPDSLPATYVEGRGLTPFKVSFEYLLVLLYLVAALLFFRHMGKASTFNASNLFAGAITMAMSEFYFTLYASVTDVYNLAGHLYKAIAYLFLYQAIFRDTIQHPYHQLEESRRQLQATLETLPDQLLELTGDGVYVAVHAASPDLRPPPDQRLVGKKVGQVMPPESAAIMAEAIAEAASLGTSRGRRVALELAGSRYWFGLSVARKLDPEGGDPTFLVLARDITESMRQEQQLDAFFSASLDLFCISTLEGRFLRLNPEWENVLGYSMAELEGRQYLELVHPEDRDITIRAMTRLQADEKIPQFENRYRHRDGSYRYIEWRADPRGDLVYSAARDITERRRQQETMRKLSEAVDQSPFPILITGADGAIEYVNAAFTAASGYRDTEVIGRNPSLLKSGKTPTATYRQMWQQLRQGNTWEGELINRSKDGREYTERTLIYPIRDDDNRVTHYLAHKADITAQKAAAQRIEQLSYYDQLTGLPNQELLHQAFDDARAEAEIQHRKLSLLWCDLDNFKDINDALGHETGDMVLREIADRVRLLAGRQGTLSRHSGDSFVLLLADTSQDRTALMAERLLETLATPIRLPSRELIISGSIGIAVFPDDGQKLDNLLTRAEAAMYDVKRRGRNGYSFYTPEMQLSSSRLLELSSALKRATEHHQLHLVYQPQVRLADGALVGAEALLRWHHPQLGPVSPAEFIPIAENNGTINRIDTWVLNSAVDQLRRWHEAGLAPLVLAINLSASQFDQQDLAPRLLALTREAGIEAGSLEVELTEASMMRNPATAGETVRTLRHHGVKVAIDDFGTGYSSLGYLRDLRATTLKIDQSFVRGVEQDNNKRSIVKAIIEMAHSLDMIALAEGVETAAELEVLRELGCDVVQGYLVSRPLAEEDFAGFVESYGVGGYQL